MNDVGSWSRTVGHAADGDADLAAARERQPDIERRWEKARRRRRIDRAEVVGSDTPAVARQRSSAA